MTITSLYKAVVFMNLRLTVWLFNDLVHIDLNQFSEKLRTFGVFKLLIQLSDKQEE